MRDNGRLLSGRPGARHVLFAVRVRQTDLPYGTSGGMDPSSPVYNGRGADVMLVP